MSKYHRGKIVQRVVKDNGYKLKVIADKLKMSRGTLYKYFGQPDLDSEFIIKLGKVIKYKFDDDIPDLTEDVATKIDYEGAVDSSDDHLLQELQREVIMVQRKYYRILEEHTNVLHFLVRVSTDKKFEGLTDRVREFVKNKKLL